jgi:hypothetical protein
MVNNANVVCGGVTTTNATVYLIDSVLLPPSNLTARARTDTAGRDGVLLLHRRPADAPLSLRPGEAAMNAMPTVLWFRRDLRLSDLPPLLEAAGAGTDVLACFVLDPRLEAASGARRLQFPGDSLRGLDQRPRRPSVRHPWPAGRCRPADLFGGRCAGRAHLRGFQPVRCASRQGRGRRAGIRLWRRSWRPVPRIWCRRDA